VSGILGAVFVAVQGYEWLELLSQGLNMQRSAHASFFYLIVGTHGVHVIGGLVGLLTVVRRMLLGTATLAQLRAAQVFWSFVVLIWPVLYVMVYL
jgi:heme/copper-type cytochrome/quinol oxidase subunit 3